MKNASHKKNEVLFLSGVERTAIFDTHKLVVSQDLKMNYERLPTQKNALHHLNFFRININDNEPVQIFPGIFVFPANLNITQKFFDVSS